MQFRARRANWAFLSSALFYSLLSYAALLLFSLNFQPISTTVDASWVFAMNYYAHGPELFGKDLVFTYGPLAYLAVPENVGKNLAVAAAVHVALWCVLLYLLQAIGEGRHKASGILILVALIFSNRLYFNYWDYLLVFVAVLSLVLLIRKPGDLFPLGILALVAGLEFLVKFSGFILIALLLAIYAASRLRVVKQTSRGERVMLLLAILAGPIAYFAYNPSLSGLIGYLRGSLNIAAGYSAVMSTVAEPALLRNAAVLCFSLAILTGFFVYKRLVTVTGAAMVLLFTWMAFKHGYTRGGPSHAAIFFGLMTVAPAFLASQISWTRSRRVLPASVCVCLMGVSLFFEGQVLPVWNLSWWAPAYNLRQTAHLFRWNQMSAMLAAMSDESFKDSLISQYSAALGHSRVLFFPWDVSYASRGDFHAVPFYTTQAYSAYTHYLDQQSADHITRASPPIDYVLLEWKSADTRNPFVDVPVTWNALFSGFEPVPYPGEALLLKPRLPPLPIRFQQIATSTCRSEEWIAVPDRATPVAMSLEMRPKLTGNVLTFLYQMGPVNLEVRTRNGLMVLFRVPPDTVSFPFPINYLPLNIPLLHTLWRENRTLDPIIAFRLVGPGVPYFNCGAIRFYDVLGTSVRVG